MMTYNEIKREIEDAPMTWIPGLLRAVVDAAIKNKVFVAGGLQTFVSQIIDLAK